MPNLVRTGTFQGFLPVTDGFVNTFASFRSVELPYRVVTISVAKSPGEQIEVKEAADIVRV